MRKSVFVLVLSLILALAVTSRSDQILDGMEAYLRGDYAEALNLLRPFAERGEADAQFSLGSMYYEGHGVRKDYVEAVRWFRKAAEQGDADAQFNLGVAYNEAEGVLMNHAEAAQWYHKAAEQGHTEAQFNLGIASVLGEGILQSTSAAVDWFYKSGMNFLQDGEREKALMAYDRINFLNPGHFLGEKLKEALYP